MTQSYRFHHYTPRRSETDDVARERSHRAVAEEHSGQGPRPDGQPYGATAEKGAHPPGHRVAPREGPGPVPTGALGRQPAEREPVEGARSRGQPIGALPVTREPMMDFPKTETGTGEAGWGMVAKRELRRWAFAAKELGAASFELAKLPFQIARRMRHARTS